MPAVLVDAGALVALLDRSDHLHDPCVRALDSIRDPLLTVWPALTEAMHLLGGVPLAQRALAEMIESRALEIADLSSEDVGRMSDLMHKFADLPMDFADAALVRIAERDGLHRILTFDAHFRVYRLPRRTRFVLVPDAVSATAGRRGKGRHAGGRA